MRVIADPMGVWNQRAGLNRTLTEFSFHRIGIA